MTKKYSDLVLIKRLLLEAKAHWLSLAAILLIDLLATPISLLAPIPLKIAVDSVIGSKPVPGFLVPILPAWATNSRAILLAFAAGLVVLLALLNQLQGLIDTMLRTRTGEAITLNFRARLFRHAQRLSFGFHDSRGTTDSIYRIQYDSPAVQWVSIYGIIPLVSSFAMLITMIYVIGLINLQLAVVALAISPFLFFVARTYGRRVRDWYLDLEKRQSQAMKVIQEVLTSFRVVKAFGREDDEEKRFLRQSSEGVRAKVRVTFAETAFGLVSNVITAVGTALVLFIGIQSVQSGTMTLGDLLIVVAYLSSLYGPLRSVSGQIGTMQASIASAQRAYELLDEEPEVAERPNAKPIKHVAGAIEFRDVSFAYDNMDPVLRNISFRVEPGIRVGIAGATGSGKTTLVSLLTRFYDPTEGQILLDGVDLRDYKLADLRNQFALVLQEPVLFSFGIAENIAYARPEADFEEVVAAAKAAGAHEFIMSLPEAYDTLVGERGMRLSGGERQRISLARAFLKDAPMLILDEPTSSVDMQTEADIMKAAERLMHGKTTFIVAHRLSTLQSCDVLLRIEDGQIVSLTTEVATAIRNWKIEGR